MIVEVSHPTIGKAKVVNTPIKLSRTPASVERGCPHLGEHTREILASLLGMTEGEIEDLV